MSPITPGYGLDPTPRPPSKTRFAAALDATEEAPVATPKAQRPPPSPLDSLATLSPLKEPTEGVAAPEARRPPPPKRSPPPPRAAPWPFFRHPSYEYRAPRVSAWASSYGTTYGATAPAWTPMPVSPTLTNLTSLYRRRVRPSHRRRRRRRLAMLKHPGPPRCRFAGDFFGRQMSSASSSGSAPFTSVRLGRS